MIFLVPGQHPSLDNVASLVRRVAALELFREDKELGRCFLLLPILVVALRLLFILVQVVVLDRSLTAPISIELRRRDLRLGLSPESSDDGEKERRTISNRVVSGESKSGISSFFSN